MDDIQALVQWAEAEGVQLDGIEPARLPGRGVGIVATRSLQVNCDIFYIPSIRLTSTQKGDVVLVIPKDSIRSLHTLPQDISEKLPPDTPIHGLLAADLTLDQSRAPWRALLPTYSDLEASVPFLWPAELQELLPSAARSLLAKQQAKFGQHWETFHASFPATPRGAFLHAWLLVNTRTFYYETPETMLYPWEDRLALLPVADLFNHGEAGCRVEFTSEWYSVTADRAYEAGGELYISYGDHSNDFLLGEYGFVLRGNRWDKVCLDDVILPKLSGVVKEELERRELLGEYMISDSDGLCERTKAALEVLIRSEEGEEWKTILDQGEVNDQGGPANVQAKLKDITREALTMAKERLDAAQRTEAGSASQRSTLAMRWTQIIKVLEKFV